MQCKLKADRMHIENERKFLIKDGWQAYVRQSSQIVQAYISTDAERTVRVRTVQERGYLTIKGKNIGGSCMEYEYEIPIEDARSLIENIAQTAPLRKIRHTLIYENSIWTVDQYEELLLAEFEYSDENRFPKTIPHWVLKEVTGDPNYFNSNIAKKLQKSRI